MDENRAAIFGCAYHLGAVLTLAKLALLDGYVYNWWNWIIAIPCDFILSEIWPIYWLVLRPIFG